MRGFLSIHILFGMRQSESVLVLFTVFFVKLKHRLKLRSEGLNK